jgi:hypothetical protein
MMRPTRRSLLRAGLAGGLAGLGMGSPGLAATDAPAPRLRRGISLWPWFSLTREYPPPSRDYGWPAFQTGRPVPDAADLRRLAAAGFDFVRVPVDPGPFLALGGSHRLALMGDLDRAVEAVREAGLALVLNIQANGATHTFNPDNLYGRRDAPLLDAYTGFVAELAGRYRRNDHLVLEPVNEPPQACGADDWNGIQSRLLAAARSAAPHLPLLATGACGGMMTGLIALDPPALARFAPLFYGFHFYEPYLFTHQGAPWMREPVYRDLTGVPWPARSGDLDRTLAAVRSRMSQDTGRTTAEQREVYALTERKLGQYFEASPNRAWIDHYLGLVQDWARLHTIPSAQIVMGEFGVLRTDRRYHGAARADRLRYLRDVRASAEACGFGWALWNLFDGMGLVDETTQAWDPGVLDALGLKEPPDTPTGGTP